MSIQHPRLAVLALTCAIGFAAACGAAKSSTNAPPTGQGQLAVALVDAPPDNATQIWVTITQVTAHTTSSGWVTIPMAAAPVTLDLMTLQAPASAAALGFVNLPKGTTITQVRLYVAPEADKNWVILTDGSKWPLKVPSGSQSGIKIHGPWQIAECSQTTLTLDFDGKKSIFSHPAQQGNEWILRPVIRVKKVDTLATGCSTGGAAGPSACDLASPQCPDLYACTPVGESAVCLGLPGAGCTSGSECLNGSCDPVTNLCEGGIGGPCSAESACVFGLCAEGTCQGKTDAPCNANAQCDSKSCADGSCAAPSGGLPPGITCLSDDQCLSDWCEESECAASAQGHACTVDTDCQAGSGLACIAGLCDFSG